MTELLNAIDLFAGAGGWDVAPEDLGISPLGIELDDAACATREAAGLRTLQGDVAALDPRSAAQVDVGSYKGPLDLLIASPPCPTFSSAGNGAGRSLTDVITRCLHELAAGSDSRAERRQEAFEILQPACWEAEQKKAAEKNREPDREKADARARRDADMSLLVVEPLRYILALEPRFVALEQVPEVLGIWSAMAAILNALGYQCWTGVLLAEQYGVPQTRKRAILMADREEPVKPPAPTHQRYLKPRRDESDHPALFEAPEAERRVHPEDRDLLPWVSMAEALGAGRGALVHYQRNGATGEYAERLASEPAFTVATNADRWVYDRRQTGGDGTPVGPRSADEPAPTLQAQGLAKGRDVWTTERPAPTLVTTRRSKDGILVGRQLPEGEGENVGGHDWKQSRDSGPGAEREPRDLDDPSYTIRGSGSGSHPSGVKWVGERPSTTVNGDPRISAPGRHDPEESGSQQNDAIRVSLEEALILQSFPPNFPVQGTKSQRFLQVGNAVPPLLAHAILTQLLQPVLEQERAKKHEDLGQGSLLEPVSEEVG